MTSPLPAKAPGDSLNDPPSSLVVCPSTQTLDVTDTSFEFSVDPRVQVVELVCKSATGTSPNFTIGLDGWDPAANGWEVLITSAAVTSAATTVVQVNPETAPITNSSCQRPVRRRMRVNLTVTSGTTTGSLCLHSA